MLLGWCQVAEGRARRRSPRRAEPGSGRGPTFVAAKAIMLLGWCRAAKRGRARRHSPPGRALLGPGPHMCGCPGHRTTRLVPSKRGRCKRRFSPGRARLRPGPHLCGCPRDTATACRATRLAPSSGGESATQLPAGPSPAWTGAPRVWAPRPLRHSVGADPTQVVATANMLLGWCQVTVGTLGRARRRSPPGRVRLGPGPHVCGCQCVPWPSRDSVGAEQLRKTGTLLPAGPSPSRAGAPRKWVPRSTCYLVGAK